MNRDASESKKKLIQARHQGQARVLAWLGKVGGKGGWAATTGEVLGYPYITWPNLRLENAISLVTPSDFYGVPLTPSGQNIGRPIRTAINYHIAEQCTGASPNFSIGFGIVTALVPPTTNFGLFTGLAFAVSDWFGFNIYASDGTGGLNVLVSGASSPFAVYEVREYYTQYTPHFEYRVDAGPWLDITALVAPYLGTSSDRFVLSGGTCLDVAGTNFWFTQKILPVNE